MAYFAQLDDTNTVIAVNCISNDDCLDESNNESEAVGVAFCKTLWGNDTNWKQTSVNTKGGIRYLPNDGTSAMVEDEREGQSQFRKNYAEIGGKYDASSNSFILEKPYPSWLLNTDFGWYEPPVAYPGITNYQQTGEWSEKYDYKWNEASVNWVLI